MNLWSLIKVGCAGLVAWVGWETIKRVYWVAVFTILAYSVMHLLDFMPWVSVVSDRFKYVVLLLIGLALLPSKKKAVTETGIVQRQYCGNWKCGETGHKWWKHLRSPHPIFLFIPVVLFFMWVTYMGITSIPSSDKHIEQTCPIGSLVTLDNGKQGVVRDFTSNDGQYKIAFGDEQDQGVWRDGYKVKDCK